MEKCLKCIFYRIKPNSLNYNLSICLKHDTFATISRLDNSKCGYSAKDYIHLPPPDFQKNYPDSFHI